jgi:hypothetical protein
MEWLSRREIMKKIFLVVGAILFLWGMQTAALATPTLLLDDGNGGIAAFTVVDQSPLDSNPIVGVVTYIGSVGVWNINVTTGITKPAAGSATDAYMDLSSVAYTSNSNGGELDIFFTEDGFVAPPSGVLPIQMSVGGTTSGTVLSRWDINAFTSNPFENLGILGPFTGAFSGSLYNSTVVTDNLDAQTGTFSLTSATIINQSGAGSTSFNQELKAVPEVGSLLFLGVGLIGITFASRRMRRKC